MATALLCVVASALASAVASVRW